MKKRFCFLLLIPLLTSCEGSTPRHYAKAQKYMHTLESKRIKEFNIDNPQTGIPQKSDLFDYTALPNKCAYLLKENSYYDIFDENAKLTTFEVVINKKSNWIYLHSFNSDSTFTVEKLFEWDAKTKLSFRTDVYNGEVSTFISYEPIEKNDWYINTLYGGLGYFSLFKFLTGWRVKDCILLYDYETFFHDFDEGTFKVNSDRMKANYYYKSYIDESNMVCKEPYDSQNFREIKVKTDAKFSRYICEEYKEYLELDGKISTIRTFNKVKYRSDFLDRMRSYK